MDSSSSGPKTGRDPLPHHSQGCRGYVEQSNCPAAGHPATHRVVVAGALLQRGADGFDPGEGGSRS